MSTGWLVIPVGLLAAFAFAVSSSLKHVSAGQVPDAHDLRPHTLLGFIRSTLAHPLWLGGIVADLVGLVLQAVALHLGALAVVQPLLVAGLLFALLLRARYEHNITLREVAWAAILTAALGGFLVISGTSRSTTAQADRGPALAAALIGIALAVVCVHLGRAQSSRGRAAALMGVALGAVYAATAGLLKALTDIGLRSPAALLTSWQLYTLILLGAFSLLLTQLTFQAGPLTASLPAMSTVDPLLSIAIGVVVYDEHLRSGPAAGAGLIGLLVILGTAILQLSRAEAHHQPQVHGPSEERVETLVEDGRWRRHSVPATAQNRLSTFR
jgi:drug/metabolite transporter (DMT)-like permease